MRKMLPAILAGGSAAFCVLLCGLAVHSFWRYDYIDVHLPPGGGGAGVVLEAGRGSLDVTVGCFDDPVGGWVAAIYPLDGVLPLDQGPRVGARWRGRLGLVAEAWGPGWAWAALAGLPAAWWAWRRRKRWARGFPVEAAEAAYPE